MTGDGLTEGVDDLYAKRSTFKKVRGNSFKMARSSIQSSATEETDLGVS